jgi:protein SCO1/2
MRPASLWQLIVLAWSTLALAHEAPSEQQRLPTIGPAPDFVLTSQDGLPVTLGNFRSKVVALTFIFVSCTDTCPLLTATMALVQDQLGSDFGPKVAFISITVDPERDTPEVLKQYARTYGADLAGWAFLTGAPAAIREVVHRYAVFASKSADGDVSHTFLTSIIDPQGVMRVQYLGGRFRAEEFRRDLLSLLDEP